MKQLKQAALNILAHKSRLIGKIESGNQGPTLVFSGGIHGNEPSGVIALVNVLNTLQKQNIPLKGNLLAIIGNVQALHAGMRYITQDLNRLWTPDHIYKLHNGGFDTNEITPEVEEMIAIDNKLIKFVKGKPAEHRYFIDLHTTSSFSAPFAAIDKMHQSIAFARLLPIPFIVNLDDYLKGTLLHYLDHINFGAMVFEAGQHDDPNSVRIHEALIWMVLVTSGALAQHNVPNYEGKLTLLSGLHPNYNDAYQIIHREPANQPGFKMLPGFVNFQPIKKGQPLATTQSKQILSPYNGFMFMPLYQNQGQDGFFIIEKLKTPGF